MADVLFVLITCAFFGLAAVFVRACERIIGPSEDALTPASPPVIEVVEPELNAGEPVGSAR